MKSLNQFSATLAKSNINTDREVGAVSVPAHLPLLLPDVGTDKSEDVQEFIQEGVESLGQNVNF